MHKLILLFTIIAVHPVGAEEDFRPWQTFNGTDFDVFLKTLYKRDITAGRLIGYDPAFSVETLKLSKEQMEWLQAKGAGEKSLRAVKLTVKVYPLTDPNVKPSKKPEPKEVDMDFPLLFFSDKDQDYVLDWDWLQKRQPFFKKSLQVVFGEARDMQKQRRQPGPQYDLIYLREGSRSFKIKGVVQNTRVALHTDYGRFVVNRDRLAGMQFRDESGSLDTVIGVNNNRLSGFLSLPADPNTGAKANLLTYEGENGEKQEVRKEKIARIIFRVREDELNGLGGDTTVYVRLKNGDAFDARIPDGEFKLGGRREKVADVRRVAIKDGTPTFLLKSGSNPPGEFSTPDLPFELELGPQILIYSKHLEQISCESTYRPVGRIVEASDDGDVRLSFQKNPAQGKVLSVSSRSAFGKMMEKGDRIVSINGRIPEFQIKGDDSYELACEALFEGKTIPYIVLGVERGKQVFHITILPLSGV